MNVFNPFTAVMPFDLKMTDKKVRFEIHKPYFPLILAYVKTHSIRIKFV